MAIEQKKHDLVIKLKCICCDIQYLYMFLKEAFYAQLLNKNKQNRFITVIIYLIHYI